jgi:simple sugar transport system substrate-binding protein
MKRTAILVVLLVTAVLLLSCRKSGPGVPSGKRSYTIATIVKLDGVPWFERMREGVKKFRDETGHKCFLMGPPQADAAGQVQIIENVIAQGVDAICVVPFSAEAIEPVLRKARSRGIIVVSHEASNQVNADAIVEPFDNFAYGAHLMDHLAHHMGEQGQYAVFVGSLTLKSHNDWIDGAIARQKEKYPQMELVTERIEEHDSQDTAYERTRELIEAYPEIRGILGSTSTTAAGAGLAVKEKGLQEKLAVVGSGLVSQCRQYLASGSTKLISFWDPADAGYVMNKIAVMLLEGKKLTNGADLGVPGYTQIRQDPEKPNLFYGSAWVDVTKQNMDAYKF